MTPFNERLKKFMKDRDISQIELSRRTGIARSALSEYMAGKYLPKQNNIYKISIALGITPADLLGMEEYLAEQRSIPKESINALTNNKEQEIARIVMTLSEEAQEKVLLFLQRKDLDIDKLFEKREISDLELEYVEMYRALPAVQKENVKMIIRTFYDAMDNQAQEKEEA